MKKSISNQRMVSFIVSLVYFVETLDSSILNTAIPAISSSLNVDPLDLKIALISYLLSFAIFVPISGWLADKFGTKKTFTFALIVFTLSSLWCGFSHNLTELIIARFVQGIGGSMGFPIGRLIIVRTFGRQHFITQMNKVILVGSFGVMLGPVIGGLLTTYFSWQWIFWVNIPIGFVNLVLVRLYLDESKHHHVPPLDIIGFLLFGIGLSGLTFGLSALSESYLNIKTTDTILIMSILFLILYAFYSHRQTHPIVKTDLLRIHTFNISVLTNLIFRIGVGGMPFLLPLIFQIHFGYSPPLSGLLLAPIALGVLCARPFSLRFLRLFGYKYVLLMYMGCLVIIILLFCLVDKHTELYMISLLTFGYGLILALQYSAMNSLAYANIETGDFSAATSIMATVQQIGQSFGVAFCALMIHMFSFIFSEHDFTLTVFRSTLFAMASLSLLSGLVFMRLKANDGQEMIV